MRDLWILLNCCFLGLKYNFENYSYCSPLFWDFCIVDWKCILWSASTSTVLLLLLLLLWLLQLLLKLLLLLLLILLQLLLLLQLMVKSTQLYTVYNIPPGETTKSKHQGDCRKKKLPFNEKKPRTVPNATALLIKLLQCLHFLLLILLLSLLALQKPQLLLP